MIVRGDIKKYIGAVESEEIAARFYDKYALIIQGFEVSSRLASQLSLSQEQPAPTVTKKIFEKLRAIKYIFQMPTHCFNYLYHFACKLADPKTQIFPVVNFYAHL